MNKPVIVSGEASETDSEDEINSVCPTGLLVTNQLRGQEVSGEDSESENENDEKGVSMLAGSNTIEVEKKTSRNSSLLHQKLRETNVRFYNNLENFVTNVIGESEKSLAEVDQQILKSQLVVQGAATSLKNLNLQANTLKMKLHTLLSSNFLSNVKISL